MADRGKISFHFRIEKNPVWCGVVEEHGLDRIRRRIRQDLRCHHFVLICHVGLRVLCNHAEFLAAA